MREKGCWENPEISRSKEKPESLLLLLQQAFYLSGVLFLYEPLSTHQLRGKIFLPSKKIPAEQEFSFTVKQEIR
ncbi:MAG: hypothetical protein DRG80_06530 [Deltaproteobacteria bacterium]|nr:MAG: hypothetical protein DRG80_06530 [Deltaproteobacteria bacterium]